MEKKGFAPYSSPPQKFSPKKKMENREDLNSILPFLPLILRSSSIFWPSRALEALKALSRGPYYSEVDSGAILFDAIVDLRDSLGLSRKELAIFAGEGYSLFFDDFMSRVESRKCFGEIIPAMASLLLRLPSLLEDHYRSADSTFGKQKDGSRIKTGLRLLGPQEAGIVFLSQELVGALLACSFFCLFPVRNRDANHLPSINFDYLFACLYQNGKQSQEHKIKCLIHYFERICLHMPMGVVSFERKVLPSKYSPLCILYPDAEFWSKSSVSLCSLEVSLSGLIEDQQYEALEVDFANEYIGGGALHAGCVQVPFLNFRINNEAIEIVGAERFSNYSGYASSFQFLGDCLDNRPVDSIGRRKTRIVAIDALCWPGLRQYGVEGLLRETNKAYCGFFDESKRQDSLKLFQEGACCSDKSGLDVNNVDIEARDVLSVHNDSLAGNFSSEKSLLSTQSPDRTPEILVCSPLAEMLNERQNAVELIGTSSNCEHIQGSDSRENIGVATGNWGCGAFGGDPELKSIIQWLAASQALRHFILYYTFGEKALQRLGEVSQWILSHKWTVGDLWNLLVEYSFQRLNGKTRAGFLNWILPSLHEQN
ncbi:poly(ADP-ribose) glycohydrolase 1-like isoform X2 [Tasmannia lanceolata]|uniref:poly(ADP-ribose) glycohydrolase 1-like isoform X2 n=1 Tax=Tasmannia lanceolata TaxID=3420 RepID=UPI004064A566